MENPPRSYLYQEIAGQISSAIDRGTIPEGGKLPSLRETGRRFDCSLSVVMQAYGELERQDIIYSVEKSGYYASSEKPGPPFGHSGEIFSLKSEEARPLSIIGQIVEAGNDRSLVPLGAGIPHEALLPLAGIKKSIGRVLREDPGQMGRYTYESGSFALRKEICRLMLARGVTSSPDDILITNGCMEALSQAVESVSQPGEVIAVESPLFLGVIQLLNDLGRRILPIPASSREGIDPDILEKILEKGEVKALMMTGAFQNPLGFVMPEKNRRRAVEILSEYGIPLIEDDLYSDCSHRGERIRPLKSFDREGSVVYCSSFSKTIGPGLRIGWLMGGRYHSTCRQGKLSRTLGGSSLIQEAAADFLKRGSYQVHVRRLQRAVAGQAGKMKPLLLSAFPAGTLITSPRGGYYFWVELPVEFDTGKLFAMALGEGISIVPGEAFGTGGRFRNCLRLSYGSPVTEQTARAVETLGRLIPLCRK